MQNEYASLLRTVENVVGRSLVSSADFQYLSDRLFEKTNERLSVSTLMRLWGYRPSVTPRKYTLDVLARFLGYSDSVEFFSSLSDESINTEIPDETAHFLPKRKSRKKLFVGLIGGLVIAAAAIFLFFFLQHSPTRIVQLSELKNTKQYVLKTKNGKYGELGVMNFQLATNYELARNNRCLEQSTFAILQYEGDYYLYSIADRQFLNVWRCEVDAPIARNGVKLKLTPRDSCFVLSFSALGHTYTLNVYREEGILITDYGIETDSYDEGNMLEIYEAGDFDPTEPLQRIKQYRAELEKAQKTLVPEMPYCIYTLIGNEGQEETKRYYLSANGRLTDTFSDSCRLVLHKTEGDTLYVSPGFRFCLHEAGKPVPQGCKVTFDFSKYGTPQLTDHLETANYTQDTFNGQTCFLNESGCYAIRCTNAPTSNYFAGGYWDVKDINKDGRPDIFYSSERNFVWHVEPL